jgi:deoxyxylulose-5-phosphate synthase
VDIIALPDSYVEHGSQPKLREKVGLTPEKIAQSALEFHKQTAKSGV